MERASFFWGTAVLCLACGGSSDNPLNGDGGGGDTSIIDTGADGGDMSDTGVDTGADTFTCDNLECQVVKCDAGSTTLSGVITTPNGQYPIYNAQVYVPNAATSPIPDGVTCDACQAPLSGKPLIYNQLAIASTDEKGAFQLKDVPVGTNIPLVIQVGKWRREVKIASVAACTDNVLPKDQARLPKNQAEGHLPLIALQTGCDRTECTIYQRIGIDPAEFTGPMGTGRIHVYQGQASTGIPTSPGNPLALWATLSDMKKYDLLLNACECNIYARDTMGPAYDNLKSYLEAGGRFIGTHYHYNWFANSTQCGGDMTCKGPTAFNNVAKWAANGAFTQNPTAVDTHPRGTALAKWLVNNGASMMQGNVDIGDTRDDVGGVSVDATRWLSQNAGAESTYFTFNNPIGGMKQCGRAAFSDMHVRTEGGGATWPTSCMQQPPYVNNELAFTFLFFDMFSCVQDDSKMPITPPTQ